MVMIRVSAEYDPEASVWVAESNDIPLITEADTVEALHRKLPGMVADLIDGDIGSEVKIDLVTHSSFRMSKVA
ncbi:MAG: DUF1902 domain-containing protein [Bradyrhizobium sp.]|uniref:DUF1902 domain-containing protein n=1 Tax=Bradyrhizobium sp. TaxID=376 RepID=UPI003BF3EF45